MKTETEHLEDKLKMANIIGYCIGDLEAEKQYKEFLDNLIKKPDDI